MKTKRALFSLIVLIFTVCLLIFFISKYLNYKDEKSSLKANALTLKESAVEDLVKSTSLDSNNYNADKSSSDNDNINNISDNGDDSSYESNNDAEYDNSAIENDIFAVNYSVNNDNGNNFSDNTTDNDIVLDDGNENSNGNEAVLSLAASDLTDAKESVVEEKEEEKAKYSNLGISIANSYVNIRQKPSTESSVLGKLYRDSVAKIISTEGDWYYVESGSVKGYVSSDYIQTGLSDEEIIKKYGSHYAQVTCNGLNVREEPDTEAKRKTVIYLNETYPVIELLEDWVKINVEDDNVIGYVSREYVDLIIDFPKAISKEEEAELQRLKEEERIKKETAIRYGEEVKYTQEELKLLACLVHAEAGNQSYEGKLAVANVVLNRVKSKKYPNSIKKVIYQPGQFAVASSGSLEKQLANYNNYKSTSQKLSIKAAKAALEGANNIKGRLYFHSYKSAVKKGYDHKPNAVKIDDQLFW